MLSSSRALLIGAALAAALLFSFTGCKALTTDLSPVAANVSADRATFGVVAAVLRNLTDGDPSNDPDLTGVNATALRQMLDTWELRLEQAEAIR